MPKLSLTRLLWSTLVAAFLLMGSLSSKADTLFYFFDTPFFNLSETKPSPDGPAPWLKATLTDVGLNKVDLKLESLLTGSNFVSSWLFNVDDSLHSGGDGTTLSSLVFTRQAGGTAPTGETITAKKNDRKADGDGMYDIEFAFPTSAGNRFDGSDFVTYTIQYTGSLGTLDVHSFSFASKPEGGFGPYFSAAHIQGISDPEGSTWITNNGGGAPVPEPVFYQLAALLGLGGAGLLRALRKGHKA